MVKTHKKKFWKDKNINTQTKLKFGCFLLLKKAISTRNYNKFWQDKERTQNALFTH